MIFSFVKKLVKNNKSPKTTKLEEIMTANPRVAFENIDTDKCE